MITKQKQTDRKTEKKDIGLIEKALNSFEELSKELFELWVDFGSNYEDEFMLIRRTLSQSTEQLAEIYEKIKPKTRTTVEVPIL